MTLHGGKSGGGFTLVELMVTLTVAAILAMIAVPSFRDTIRRNRVTSASNALLADLTYARGEAINRGQIVTLCPSTTGTGCAGGTNWSGGWMAYTYPPGTASINAAYTTGNLSLRAATAQNGVSVWAGQAALPTFGMQGQLKPANTTLRFITCMVDGGTATSTQAVPGIELDVNGSGAITTKPLAAGTSCTT